MNKPSWNQSRFLAIISLSLILVLPQTAYSMSKRSFSDPSVADMTIDLVMRPFYLVGTVVGAAIFIVSLPISAAGGNIRESAQKLVVYPGEATFVRCLGCEEAGYKR